MSENVTEIVCNLCKRPYKKFNKKDMNLIYGIALTRTKTYSCILQFIAPTKSETNTHICTYCIADILNKFNV